MAEHDHIARLAKLIDSDIRKDKHLLLTEIEVVGLRRQGAIELHSICADFVASVNRQLLPPVLELSPPEYGAEMFRESGVNLMQVKCTRPDYPDCLRGHSGDLVHREIQDSVCP